MSTPTVDQLVNDVYSQLRHDLVKVTVCATTVRVHRHDQPDVWLQKNAEGHYNPHGEFIVDAFDGFGDGRFDLAENSDKCANCDNAL